MAFYHRNSERKRMHHDYRRQEQEVVGSLCRLGSRPVSPNSLLEQDKRIRREIANSNERRRMQSINAGFETLRSLLPHQECEKRSKSAILNSTVDYVYQLEQEKERLQQHNNQLSRKMLSSARINHDSAGSFDSPKPKRKKHEPADCVDEGIGSSSPSRSENGVEDAKREILLLRLQLKRERTLRLLLEKQIRNFESRRYPAGVGPDSVEQIHGVTEEKNKLPLIMENKSGFRKPQYQISRQEVQSLHEITLQESTPELASINKLPVELSVEKKSLSVKCENDLSLYDVTTTPGFSKSPNRLNVSSPFPDEIQHQAASYKVSTSRQNLETIVEAIRLVEGDYLFQDDTTVSKETVCTGEEKLSVTEQHTKQVEQPAIFARQDFAIQHQKIKNAPIAQSRPGVIVSNMP